MSWDARTGNFVPAPPGQPAHDPYAPRPSSSRGCLWYLLGGGVLMALLCCGGGVAAIMFGVNVIEAEVTTKLRDNPKLREHVGEITSLKTDYAGTLAVGEDVYRYTVRGTKGSGELTVKQHTDDQGDEVIDEASLRLPDGKTIQIVP
jgi:hypothetical protein